MTSNIKRYFMIVPQVDRFKWLGTKREEDGRPLVRVRHAPVANTWKPVPVEWIDSREMAGRKICDFPIFYSIVRCASRRAIAALKPFLVGAIEVLELDGLNGEYAGIHCIRWLPAINLEGIDTNKVSIASTMFTPKLQGTAIGDYDIFGVPEIVTKIFVSSDVKAAYEAAGLTGLDFIPVEVGF